MSADRYVLTVRENGPNGGYGVIARRVMTAAEWQALDAALVDKHSPCSFSDANTHYSLRNYALTGDIDDSSRRRRSRG